MLCTRYTTIITACSLSYHLNSVKQHSLLERLALDALIETTTLYRLCELTNSIIKGWERKEKLGESMLLQLFQRLKEILSKENGNGEKLQVFYFIGIHFITNLKASSIISVILSGQNDHSTSKREGEREPQ